MRLEDKVALISGGASGIGRAEAVLFAREGAAVVVADLQEEQGIAVVDEITEAGGRAGFVRLDVRDASRWTAAVEFTEARFGLVTILCNNAGTNHRAGWDVQNPEMWQNVMDVNLSGP